MDHFADLLAVFGRMHPLLLHLPIGMLVGLGMLELVGALRGAAPVSRWMVLTVTVFALLSAASGWMLHEEDGYSNSFTLEWHERLGIGTAAAALLCCVFRFRGSAKPYRVSLLLALGLMIPAGHFGAEMTHGKGFLLEPLEPKEERVVLPPLPEPSADGAATLASFEAHVAPLLEARCTRCHGTRKRKGELRLDSPEAILAGGESGPILGEDAELLYRLHLPLDDDDHMPPESKTQLTPAEIHLFEAWVDAGAPFAKEFVLGEGSALPSAPLVVKDGEEEASAADGEAYELAILALQSHLVHVQPIEPESRLLWIDFAAIAENTDDALVEQLLAPLVDHLSELSLARTKITAKTMALVAVMPHLTRLDLGQTTIADAGLASLRNHQELRQLVLRQTQVSEASAEVLSSLPALTHLWLWGSGFTAEGIAQLRESLPAVAIVVGDSFPAEPLEVEAELVFTSDAPLVDAPPVEKEATPEASAALTPSNTLCPVSGKPVDPRYTILYEGKVLGFCCPNCPKTFWEDPTAYAEAVGK